MNHVAIIEDEIETARHYRDQLCAYLRQRGRRAEIDLYPHGRALLGNFKHQYDLLLMDIQMDELDRIPMSV